MRHPIFWPLAACVALLLAAATLRAEPLATIAIAGGDHEVADVPMSVELPRELAKKIVGHPALFETTGGQRIALRTALEQAGNPPRQRVLFILEGRTAAGATRTFELLAAPNLVKARDVNMERTDAFTDIAFDGQTVLRYNHEPTKLPAAVGQEYLRGATIHPIFTPSCKLMTEDFPADHFHHKGLWLAWTSTEFDGRKLDFWNLAKKQGTVRFAKYGESRGVEVRSAFQATHHHIDLTQKPGKAVLEEQWDVSVWAVGGKKAGYFLFDLTSTQRCAAGDKPLVLKQERYGGLGYRGPKDWGKRDYDILTSEGKTYADAHGTRARWSVHSGKVGGEPASILFLSHPDNTRHPEPMRTSGGFGPFFNWAPTQAGDLTLEPGRDHVFRYRFMVADGVIGKETAEAVWQAFAKPPRATLEIKP